MIRTIAPGTHDTQCGFVPMPHLAEIYSAADVEQLLHVELLFIARQLATRREIPIPWYFNPESKVSVLRDSLKMALDLIIIRLNGLRGRYRVGYGAEV
jgi:dolichyl-phosphate beta-glucosyltransferase